MADSLTDEQLMGVLQHYLTILQGHPSAEEMMRETLTEDFQTGFVGGRVWKGIDGLSDFLKQRDGFFDEKHTIEELLDRGEAERDLTAETRLNFFLRSWTPPSPTSEEFTGRCFYSWRVREVDGNGSWQLRWWSASVTSTRTRNACSPRPTRA